MNRTRSISLLGHAALGLGLAVAGGLHATTCCISGGCTTVLSPGECVAFGGTVISASNCDGQPCALLACPGIGSCYEVHGPPGCSDAACCEAICTADPFCCTTTWDALCVDAAWLGCAGCGAPGANSCFQPHAGTGCSVSSCCQVVCAADPFCCATMWDTICVGKAFAMCCSPTCFGDLDGNLAVDGADLGILLASWGPGPGCADLDGNGIVDGADLGVLLSRFGLFCVN
ncbi:MAG TPA: hypothetical protein PKC43_02455 [Phycisphaerales bacterium]|nr:hypothetical protein [Phycisphaerales bacterium]HMP36287.1 hypothetical protein [Phycisphaerales bacterium]